MSAHVFLNLLNSLGKKKMRGFVKHLIGFPNEFNKFNDAEVECKILFIIIKLLKSHLRSGLPK